MSGAAARVAADPAVWAVETTLLRALAVLRVVVLVNAVVVNLLRWDDLARPWLAVAALAVMTGWTAFATWAYDDARRRRAPLLVADLLVTTGLILLTPAVQGTELETPGTLPSFWVMAVVLAWGVRWNLPGGLVAGVVVSVADLSIRSDLSQPVLGNVFLLMIGGPVVGYTSGLLKEMAVARDRAEREAAAAAERARLARVVHDGVLQVLSLVQRRGRELGGEAAELGRLAGEQEVALRGLVQQQRPTAAESADLAEELARLASATVTVSVPGAAVPLPTDQVAELVSVVRACLDNTARHVGADAPAWVLLEDLGDELVLTVRDDGPGIPEGRLEEAQSEGRLGVSESILGRVRDVGGEARLVTGPGRGTEWEVTLPRRAGIPSPP